MAIDLSSLSDKELQEELSKRKEERYVNKVNERQGQAIDWLNKIDVILELVGKHSRSSCSDENPCNYNGKCSRCTLMYFKSDGYWDIDYVLDINLYKQTINKEEM